ncbi:AT-rich interactive domain-containing protein 5 [Dionaea muscipula]
MSNSDIDPEASAKMDQDADDASPDRPPPLDAKIPLDDDDGDDEEDDDSLSSDSDDDDDEHHHRDQGMRSPNANDNELSTPETDPTHRGRTSNDTPTALNNHNHHHHHQHSTSESGRNGTASQISPAAAPRSAPKQQLVRTALDATADGEPKPNTASKKLKMTEDEEAGTPEEQVEFMNEVETFYRERSLEFKAPKFYGEPLNCLKLWNAVVRLGGYDRVTASKLWRQVGESFHPPKTCTTVSWTFRIFYEKALLEYEKHKRQIGELEFPGLPLSEPTATENEGSGSQNTGSGRARRDAAARAMQGWHAQRLEVGEPIIKDKNHGASQKREKQLKSIGINKLKKPSNLELADSDLHMESNKQLLTTVVDVGPPADWVKINVRESKDCFEVYALVPGLLREEVRVQSDPAGRLVITGQPEQLENPWGIAPFRKIVNLPARINPLQTSAVVSLHGRLFVRVPFERSSV